MRCINQNNCFPLVSTTWPMLKKKNENCLKHRDKHVYEHLIKTYIPPEFSSQ